MLKTVWAVIREGKVELIEKTSLPDGALVLVTLLPQDEESQFWMRASQASLAEVWDNPQDDIYAQLLQR